MDSLQVAQVQSCFPPNIDLVPVDNNYRCFSRVVRSLKTKSKMWEMCAVSVQATMSFKSFPNEISQEVQLFETVSV